MLYKFIYDLQEYKYFTRHEKTLFKSILFLVESFKYSSAIKLIDDLKRKTKSKENKFLCILLKLYCLLSDNKNSKVTILINNPKTKREFLITFNHKKPLPKNLQEIINDKENLDNIFEISAKRQHKNLKHVLMCCFPLSFKEYQKDFFNKFIYEYSKRFIEYLFSFDKNNYDITFYELAIEDETLIDEKNTLLYEYLVPLEEIDGENLEIKSIKKSNPEFEVIDLRYLSPEDLFFADPRNHLRQVPKKDN